MSTAAPEVRAVLASWRDPLVFLADVLPGHLHPRDWQPRALAAALRDRRMLLRAIRGAGKTAYLVMLILWGLSQGYRVVVLAPIRSQLANLLRELDVFLRASKLPALFPAWRLYEHSLETDDPKAAVTFHSAETGAPYLEGVHADRVLLLIDEGKSIPDAVLHSLEPMLISADSKIVAVSTAGRGTNWFDLGFGPRRDAWDETLTIGVDEVPHLAPKKEQMSRLLGPADPLFLAQYENLPGGGIEGDPFFDLEKVQRAVGRSLPEDTGQPIVWALDVARFGRDWSVLARRWGGAVQPAVCWRKADLMETTGRVIQRLKMREEPKPSLICVDATGVGGGVADRLREELAYRSIRSIHVADFLGGARAPHDEEFWANAKTAAASTLAAHLERGDVSLPMDPALLAELASYERVVTSNGKARIKDPASRSPDRADATLMLFAEGMGPSIASLMGHRGISRLLGYEP